MTDELKIRAENLMRTLRNEGFIGRLVQSAPLAKYTTYGIGGPALLLTEVWNKSDLKLLYEYLPSSGLKSFILGGGANVLISDKGFDGVIIRLGGEFADYSAEGTRITTGSAVPLNRIVREGCRIGMKGIERLAGIPGWVGGAVVMNAGTYGENLSGLIVNVEIFNEKREFENLDTDQCEFSYRSSRFQNSNDLILGCILEGEKGNPKELSEIVKNRIDKRNASQPVTHPSCGCVFKNPAGEKSAGKLIEEAGLKGRTYGNAEISYLHANFVINQGGAKASDVLALMSLARRRVYEMTGIKLMPEVRGCGHEKSIDEILDEYEIEEN